MPKYAFGRKSEKCLKELDPRLQDLARLMMSKQEMDFAIVCGHRNESEQNAAFAAGASKVKFPDSKHNTLPARAYDRVPYPIPLNAAGEWDDKSPLWGRLAALERRCAAELGIEIINTIPWDRPHCELKD
ncbi:MAG: M15 family peptidase [Alphaproteobacteria bacterium]|nr:M15 family peptidase [Alphaproteobacteria bacterium]